MEVVDKLLKSVDTKDLEKKVKEMYTEVALHPETKFHFETGRILAERLGYKIKDLDKIPAESIQSFAGVGFYFDLLNLKPDKSVVDLGSGSGMDTFIAAIKVGSKGKVIGIDMTDEQRKKSEQLRKNNGFEAILYKKAYIDNTGLASGNYDAVISNGVFNLSANKFAVFQEAYRLLRKNGKLAFADIVTEKHLPEAISCDATLWAACIGGAMQRDDYINEIKKAGFRIEVVQDNPEYQFISDNASGATKKYGVKSISVLAIKD